MTKEYFEKAVALKGEIKKMKDALNTLSTQQSKYTTMEYKVRREFCILHYVDWKEDYKELKKKLTLIEKMKLVISLGNKKDRN